VALEHAHSAFSASGAFGWKTERESTNSPNSITLFFFWSKTSKT